MNSDRTSWISILLTSLMVTGAFGQGKTATAPGAQGPSTSQQAPAPKPPAGTAGPGQQAQPAPPTGAPNAAETKPAPKPVKPTDVVLWIGNETFTAARFDELTRAVPPQYEAAVAQLGKRQFATQYGTLRGLAREAEKQKVDQTPTFKEQLEFVRTELLARLALNDISKRTQAVSEEEVAKNYKERESEFQQAKLRGIFISLTPPSNPPQKAEGKAEEKKDEPKTRTDAEAKEIAEKLRQKILGGADFATVAKENSDDPATGAKGGDFGTVRKGQLPPNMEKVVFALKAKELSAPVKEARGYYLFSVEEWRTTSIEEAKPQIRSQLQNQKFMAELERVKAEFPLKFNDDYFEQQPGPVAPPQPRITGVAPAQPSAPAPAPVKPEAAKPAPPPPPRN